MKYLTRIAGVVLQDNLEASPTRCLNATRSVSMSGRKCVDYYIVNTLS